MQKISIFIVLLFATNGLWAQPQPIYIDSKLDCIDFSCNWLQIDSSDTTQLWQIGACNKPFFGTDSLAIVTDTTQPYAGNQHDYFELRVPIEFPTPWGIVPYTNPSVYFRHKYETDFALDGGYITVSFDSGATWVNMVDADIHFQDAGGFWLNTSGMYNSLDTLSDGTEAFTGDGEEWRAVQLTFVTALPVRSSGFMVPPIWLRFYFQSDSIQNNKDGWIIDSIWVAEADMGGSVSQIPAKETLRLYPNPAKDVLQLEFLQAIPTNAMYFIYDKQGRLIQQNTLKSESETIDIHTFVPDVYFIRVQTDKWTSTGRFVVMD